MGKRKVRDPDHAISLPWLGAIILTPFALVAAMLVASSVFRVAHPVVYLGVGCQGDHYHAVAYEAHNLPKCDEVEVHDVQ